MTALGPATEARIAAFFADRLELTAKDAAALIGCDVKQLRQLTDAGVIRAMRPGAWRVYTEADIRAYLTRPREEPRQDAAQCPSTNPPKAVSGTTISRPKVVDFTALRASKHAARPKGSSGRSASA